MLQNGAKLPGTDMYLQADNITGSKPVLKQEKQKELFDRLCFWANKIFCCTK